MFVHKFSVCIICCASAVLLASCSYNSAITRVSKSSGSASAASAASAGSSTQSIKVSQPTKPDFTADIVSQANLYKTSPGKVALSMLICKLDNSYVYSDLVKEDAKELFDIVNEAAVEKNATLESLNSRYDLSDILASEKIYVSIESNAVTSIPSSSDEAANEAAQATYSAKGVEPSGSPTRWIGKFQKAIRQSFKQ